MAAETTTAQCHAITQSGERCQRPAGEDGFCHQHDESDETVESYDEAEADEADGDDFSSDGGTATEESQDAEEETDASDQSQDEASAEESSAESDASGGLSGVRDVRETVQTLAPEIIGRELDAVIEVDRRDDGWLAVVEVVERPAVPDSQDILGRYEIDLDDGAVAGYRRVDRYRRSDTDADQPR